MDDPAPKIKDAEYENLEALMIQFCRVPLLAEFSRPVSLLHPEVRDPFFICMPLGPGHSRGTLELAIAHSH